MAGSKEKEHKEFSEGATPQCKTCHYWRYIHSHGKAKFRPKCCHFILDEERLTKRENGVCYSYKSRRR